MTWLPPVPNSIPHISPHSLLPSNMDFTSISSPYQALSSLRDFAFLLSLCGTPFLELSLAGSSSTCRSPFKCLPPQRGLHLQTICSKDELLLPPATIATINDCLSHHPTYSFTSFIKTCNYFVHASALYHPSIPLKYTLYKNNYRQAPFSTPSPGLAIVPGYLNMERNNK